MTTRQKQLIENYIRLKVKKALNESGKNRLTEGIMAEFTVKSERTYDPKNPEKYDEVNVSLFIHGKPIATKKTSLKDGSHKLYEKLFDMVKNALK